MSAAYFLSKRGHKVTVFERDAKVGGLAASFDFGGSLIEKYYHFICLGDDDLVDICEELGLGGDLFWRDTRMSFFYEDKLYPFGTPLDLLFFSPVSMIGRMRFGFNVMYARSVTNWRRLESEPASAWLTRHIGKQAYDVIYRPLLKIKFGEYADEVAASWMWHRIHRVANSRQKMLQRESLGYLTGGSQMLMDALSEKIKAMGGEIRLSSSVKSISVQDNAVTGIGIKDQTIDFDSVISTVALPALSAMLPDECADYRSRLDEVKYIGVVCMILKFSQPLTDSFWVNVNDSRISFNGIIEYTNLNPRPDLEGDKIAYIPYYLSTTNERFSYDNETLFDEYASALKIVSEKVDSNFIRDWRVFRDKYAQAICSTNFSKSVPDQKAPIERLYLIDSTQLYPADRTISGMIGLAKKLSNSFAEGRR